MAKAGESSFVEKHIEKALLLVCVILLGWVIMHWVMESPTQIEVPSNVSPTPLKPETADAAILSTAQRVKKQNDTAEPKQDSVTNPMTAVAQRQVTPIPPDPVPSGMNLGNVVATPVIPFINTVGDEARLDMFAGKGQVLKPSIPLISLKRELPDKDSPSDIVMHAASVIPWSQQMALWRDAAEKTTVSPELMVVRIEAEVEERPVGSQEWTHRRPVPMTAMPLPIQGGQGQIVLPRDIPKVPDAPKDKTDFKATQQVDLVLAALRQHYQKHILHPDYYALFWGPTKEWVPWTIHLRETVVTRPTTTPDGTGGGEGETPGGGPVIPGTGPVIPGTPSRIPAGVPSRGRYVPGPDGLEEPGMMRPGARGGAADALLAAQRAEEARKKRERLERIRRMEAARRAADAARRTGGRTGGRGFDELEGPGLEPPGMMRPTGPTPRPTVRPRTPVRPILPSEPEPEIQLPPEPVIVPPLDLQIRNGNVLIAFHQDTELQARMEYRYRVKVVYLNPLFMKFTDVGVKNEKDARVKTIESPWSEWSDPASVPQATEFYLAGAMQTRYVNIAVYSTCFGQRVKETFKVYAGQPIGGKRMVTVPNPAQWRAQPKAGRGGVDAPEVPPTIEKEVDFGTGAIAVEFNFAHKFPRPGLPNNTTLKILYMDYLGKLEQRILDKDKASKRRKELDGEFKRAKAAAAAAVSSR